MRGFLAVAVDAHVRVKYARDFFELEGLEPTRERVALAREDDDVARDGGGSGSIARIVVVVAF